MQHICKGNPMLPPWFRYPHIGRYSIGWRMGGGESYLLEFGDWYSGLTEEEQKSYQRIFPTPKGWLGWYEDEYTDEDIYDGDQLLWNEKGEMKYSVATLEKELQAGNKIDYLFFWGHQPSKDGSITKTCLSQWWKANFTVDTDEYCCMEQYMMAAKARLFNDKEILQEILQCNNPKQIKALGRQVRNFKDDLWVRKRYSIILNGNFAKFLQNEALRSYLLETGNKVLVEASPYDKIWGIGMSASSANAENPLLWKGQNLLGFALMEVRDEMLRIYQGYQDLKLLSSNAPMPVTE